MSIRSNRTICHPRANHAGAVASTHQLLNIVAMSRAEPIIPARAAEATKPARIARRAIRERPVSKWRDHITEIVTICRRPWPPPERARPDNLKNVEQLLMDGRHASARTLEVGTEGNDAQDRRTITPAGAALVNNLTATTARQHKPGETATPVSRHQPEEPAGIALGHPHRALRSEQRNHAASVPFCYQYCL